MSKMTVVLVLFLAACGGAGSGPSKALPLAVPVPSPSPTCFMESLGGKFLTICNGVETIEPIITPSPR